MIDLIEARHVAHVVGGVGAKNRGEDQAVIGDQQRGPGPNRLRGRFGGCIIDVVGHGAIKNGLFDAMYRLPRRASMVSRRGKKIYLTPTSAIDSDAAWP